MVSIYLILWGCVLIVGLWVTIIILKTKKEKAELERDIARTLVNNSKKVIHHEKAIQAKVKARSLERDSRIKKKVDGVKNTDFDHFYE